jgi:hypothetical protein
MCKPQTNEDMPYKTKHVENTSLSKIAKPFLFEVVYSMCYNIVG